MKALPIASAGLFGKRHIPAGMMKARSLSKSLTYQIMAVVFVMMAVITGIVYFNVREYMLDEAQERYLGILQKTYEKFRRRLSDVDVAARNNVHDIERDIDSPDMIYDHMRRIVTVNPGVKSSAILFTPGYYPEKGLSFLPMVRRDSAGVIYVAKIDSVYEYQRAKWYKECMAADSGLWVGAYFDTKRFSDINRRTMLTTYATPVHGRQGTPVGMLCLQLSFERMYSDFMKEINKANEKFEKGQSRKSYCFVIDHHGNYIMHPDRKRMTNTNFLELTKETPDSLDDRVVARMVKGENGGAMMDVDGVPSWIYYRTISEVNWTMVIVVPEEVIFHNGRTLNTIILLTVLFGLLAIYFICRHMIRQTSQPFQQAATEKDSMDQELKIASGIQMAMLPKTFPPFPERNDIDLYASVTAAREVGGDLYDYFIRDNRLFFCIGDVSGKGIPAALMMAVMRAMFRSEARRSNSARDIIETMNHNLSHEYTAGYFVTMFAGILDLTTGRLDYCNAGHEAPLISGKPLPIKPNLPVGAIAEWNYEGQEAQLQSGDLIFLYTDGLTESMDSQRQQFGRQHLKDFVASHSDCPPRQLAEILEEEVRMHARDAEQNDDITMLAIKWLQPIGTPKQLRMRADMDDIDQLSGFITEAGRQAGLTDHETKRLRLALEEAVANIINYSQATYIALDATNTGTQLKVCVTDDGVPFDPTAGSATDMSLPPDQRPPGGLGIMFLHQMTDALDYQRTDNLNMLTLYKNI